MSKFAFETENLINEFRGILDKTDACVFFSDVKTKEVVYVNEKMRKEFHIGLRGESKKCWQIIYPKQSGACEACHAKALESLESPPVVKFVYDEEKKRYYKHVDSLVGNENGALLQLHHITVIPDLEDNKSRTDFLSRMSHELYTPMNAIISMAHMAAATNETEKIKAYVSIIYKASVQLNDMINDVLDMSRIELGQVSLVNLPFELEKILAETCDISAFTVSQAKQKLRFEIDKNVPLKLWGDEFRLSQVISNLIKNILKFISERGTINVSVRVVGEVTDKAVLEFSFRTDMERENREHFCSAFEQQDEEYRHYGESSLGITISKRVVNLMGGDIRVNRIGKTEVALKFTIMANIFEYDKVSIDECVKVENLNVLLVDYHEEVRTFFRSLMNEHGIKSVCAEDVACALKLIEDAEEKGNGYSIIFVDYDMPNFDGIEIAKHISEVCKESAVIPLISIAEWTLIKENAMALGFEDFLPKPLFSSQVIDMINKIVLSRNNAYRVFMGDEQSENDEKQQEEREIAYTKPHGCQESEYGKYLPYIDIKEGLASIGGNQKIFKAMLKNFMSGNVFSDLKKSIEAENADKIQRNYDMLKSVSLNLSLVKLHKLLILYESQIKNQTNQKGTLPIMDEVIMETNKKINELLIELE